MYLLWLHHFHIGSIRLHNGYHIYHHVLLLLISVNRQFVGTGKEIQMHMCIHAHMHLSAAGAISYETSVLLRDQEVTPTTEIT